MRTLEYLSDPTLRSIYLPGVGAGVATALVCGLVSPLVVVKRMGFIGQGISHCAFGGVGVAAVLASVGFMGIGGGLEFAVVLVFCGLAAIGMGMLGQGRAGGANASASEDTAIGVYLVGSMALGAILVQVARDHALSVGRAADVRSWESILFGSVLLAGWSEAALAWGTLAVVGGVLWLIRRPLLLWAVDEEGASALGLRTGAVRTVFALLLALVVVATMKVVGVVLASALLVLPGATALRVSGRFWGAGRGGMSGVTLVSCVTGVGSILAGLVVALETGWPPGPCVVCVMIAGLVGAMAVG